jgi:O-methyltransferase
MALSFVAARRLASYPISASKRWLQKGQFKLIFQRCSDATMIAKWIYMDNLGIASRVGLDPRLAGCSIVECGTWRGGMAAGLIEVCGVSHPYHFFDSFEGLPPAQEIDGDAAKRWQADINSLYYHNNCTANESEFRATIGRTRTYGLNAKIHKGYFEKTVGTADVGAIAFLRLDGDWYESTYCCLDALFPKIAPGGFLVIDDYGTWDGCTRAVHDYLSRHKRPEPIDRFGAPRVPFLQVRSNG